MRNGSKSDRLTLVDSAGDPLEEGRDVEDSAADYYTASVSEDGDAAALAPFTPAGSILLFVTVSVACAAAAIAAGTYALWLSRHKAARETLTNVQDLLRVCQDRMHQMEDDLGRMPKGFSSPAA